MRQGCDRAVCMEKRGQIELGVLQEPQLQRSFHDALEITEGQDGAVKEIFTHVLSGTQPIFKQDGIAG